MHDPQNDYLALLIIDIVDDTVVTDP